MSLFLRRVFYGFLIFRESPVIEAALAVVRLTFRKYSFIDSARDVVRLIFRKYPVIEADTAVACRCHPDADVQLKAYQQCHGVEVEPDEYDYYGPDGAVQLVVLSEVVNIGREGQRVDMAKKSMTMMSIHLNTITT